MKRMKEVGTSKRETWKRREKQGKKLEEEIGFVDRDRK